MREEALLNNTYDIFQRQYMCYARPDSGIAQFPVNLLHQYKFDELKDKRINVFITADIAYSKSKHADETGIIVVAVDQEGDWWIIEALHGRWGDLAVVSKIFELWIKYKDFNVVQVGIESYAYDLIKDKFLNYMADKKEFMPMVALQHKNRKKEDRIRTLIPLLELGKMHIRENLTALTEQMTRFDGNPKKSGDDLLDALAYVQDLSFRPDPTEEEREAKARDDAWIKFTEDYKIEHELLSNFPRESRTVSGTGRDDDF
jgi:hypothetical protein